MKQPRLFKPNTVKASQSVQKVQRILEGQKAFYELLLHQVSDASSDDFLEIASVAYCLDFSSFQEMSNTAIADLFRPIVFSALLQDFTMYEVLLDDFSKDVDVIYIRVSVFDKYFDIDISTVDELKEGLVSNKENIEKNVQDIKNQILKTRELLKSYVFRGFYNLLGVHISPECNRFFNNYLDILSFEDQIKVRLNSKFYKKNEYYCSLFFIHSQKSNNERIYSDFEHKNNIMVKSFLENYKLNIRKKVLSPDKKAILFFSSYINIYSPYENDILEKIAEFNKNEKQLTYFYQKTGSNENNAALYEQEDVKLDYKQIESQLSETHKQTLKEVFTLNRHEKLSFGNLMGLAYALGAIIRSTTKNRLRLELNDVCSELLIDESYLLFKNVKANTLSNKNHNNKKQPHHFDEAPNYLIEQFRLAFDRSGVTPEELCLGDQFIQSSQFK